MTDRELLLSLHQKVDRNHKWVKRQFGSILHNMTATHNVVKKNRYYLHEILNRTWAVLSQVYSEEDLKTMGLKDDLDGVAPRQGITLCASDCLSNSDEDNESYQRP